MKKILVVQAEQLLGAAIISLLSNECDLNLMGCTADTTAELVEKIIHLHPDVLIMAQADQFIEAIYLLLASPGFTLRLICISVDQNWVQIDGEKQKILITKRADLASIIRYSQIQDSQIQDSRIQPTGEIFNQNHGHNNLINP